MEFTKMENQTITQIQREAYVTTLQRLAFEGKTADEWSQLNSMEGLKIAGVLREMEREENHRLGHHNHCEMDADGYCARLLGSGAKPSESK